jgi:hypothetical protein
MQRSTGSLWGLLGVVGLVATIAWAQTAAPPARAKLERLVIAVAPLGWDTNFSCPGVITGFFTHLESVKLAP